MKLGIVGASNFVNRMFEACGKYQWAREFLKNAQEAGAQAVEFGIEWQAVEKLGTYRRTVVDDGLGMDSQELLRFFSTLGEGAKQIWRRSRQFWCGCQDYFAALESERSCCHFVQVRCAFYDLDRSRSGLWRV
jgi:hypothetical protein